MKQFKFLAMAFFAMVMSIGFVACSSDDDDNNGGGSITSGKKLVRISYDSGHETINFIYGEDGKLARASKNDNGNSVYYIDLDWSGNTITLTTHEHWYENPDKCTITLDNGKISKTTDGNKTYKAIYSGNYLSKIIAGDINEYTWENGNIVKNKYVDNEGDHYCTYTYYTDMPNKHSVFDVDALCFADVILPDQGYLLIMAHPTLLGLSNKNLLKSFTDNDGYTRYTRYYTYELDNDGYPIKITKTEKENQHDTGSTDVYTLTWE